MINTLLKKWRLTGITCICVTVLAVAAWTPRLLLQSDEIQVRNQTEAIQIISAGKDRSNIRLRLKNISNKDINGYTVSLSDGTTITQDYTEGDFVFAPGKIEEDVLSVYPSTHANETVLQQNITILAVVFTDNSSEGDFKAVAEIKDRRRGIKKQLSYVLPLLKKALSASDADLPAALREFKSQILALPDRAENGSSQAVGHGLYDAKQDILLIIEKIELSQQNLPPADSKKLRKQLMEAVENSEKRVSKL